MKKIIGIVITVVILISSLNASVFANEKIQKTGELMDKKVISILSDQLPEAEVKSLKDVEKYTDSLKEREFADQPILKIYSSIYWDLADQPLDKIIEVAQEFASNQTVNEYIVFDESPFRLRKMQHNQDLSIGISETYENSVPTFISDIQSLAENMTVFNKNYKIEKIVCFDESSSHFGTVIYLQTSGGTFVKYYEKNNSDAIVFSEKEFADYAIRYYQYIISDENNYSINGDPIGGTALSFKNFIQNSEKDNFRTTTWRVVYTIILIVTITIVIVGIIIKHQKKSKSTKS